MLCMQKALRSGAPARTREKAEQSLCLIYFSNCTNTARTHKRIHHHTRTHVCVPADGDPDRRSRGPFKLFYDSAHGK